MTPTWIGGVLARELRALRREIEAYPDEAAVWQVPQGISNSGGTLALHLAGNIQYFIGAVLGGSGYVRDRDAEFNRRNVPRQELLAQIDAALRAVAALDQLDASALAKPFPQAVGGSRFTTGDWLLHLVSHFGYHLGLAFQMADDVKGTFWSSADSGKPEAGDVRKRKKTLPLVWALEHASELDRERLREIYGPDAAQVDGPMSPSEVEEVLAILDRAGAHDQAIGEAHRFRDLALADAESLPIGDDRRRELRSLVESVISL